MTIDPATALRLQFLMRVLRQACQHLVSTDWRLFGTPFTQGKVPGSLKSTPIWPSVWRPLSGDLASYRTPSATKFLPVFLIALGETPAAAIDILDKAERLGLIASADEWMALRKLRNQMVHEYIEDSTLLASALQSVHEGVSMLENAADKLMAEVERRGWV